MKLKESLVSIIIHVYNTDKFLAQCLQSLAKQSYSNIEIIAVDDYSKDNSLKILKKFKKKYDKTGPNLLRKIKILQNKKHYGVAICYNRALRLAQGQFLTFMNARDMVSPHRLKRQTNYLMANPKIAALGSQYTSINKNNKTLKKSNLPQEHEEIYHTLLPSLSLKPETVLINRMLLPKDIFYFTTNKYPYIFTEILIKLLQYGKITNLTQSFYFHRVGIGRSPRNSGKIQQAFSFLQLLLKSRSTCDYRPSLKLLFPPLLKEI